MKIGKKVSEGFKGADWTGKVAIIVAIAGGAWAVAYVLHSVVLPAALDIYCAVVRYSVGYMTLCFIVSLLNPSCGKKMFTLFWHIVEAAILDPLISLLGGKSKKKHH